MREVAHAGSDADAAGALLQRDRPWVIADYLKRRITVSDGAPGGEGATTRRSKRECVMICYRLTALYLAFLGDRRLTYATVPRALH